MLRHWVESDHAGISKRRDVRDARHGRNVRAATHVEENLGGVEGCSLDYDRRRTRKTRMTAQEGETAHRFQPGFIAGARIFDYLAGTCCRDRHVETHLTGEHAELSTSRRHMGGPRAREQCQNGRAHVYTQGTHAHSSCLTWLEKK